jgi:hypothetical protein
MNTTEPREGILGDTIQWTRPDLADLYPPASWTLTYYFVSRDPAVKFSVIATNSGGVFLIDLGAASGIEPSFERVGHSGYEWTARVVNGSEKYTIGSGFLSIAPDMTTTGTTGVEGGADRRSWAVRTLAALKAVIEGRADADVNTYMLGGKQVVKMTPDEIRKWYDWIGTMAQQELGEIAPSEAFNRRVTVSLRRGY